MKIFQKGFNYSQDGPGNRLVYHLQGCNMKCIWCSNPEGMAFGGGNEISVSDIVKEALSCKRMFFDGGGVTFTGGEATVQFEELKEVLSELKAHNIYTAIETNGTHPRLSELLPYLDYLIMDFKHYNSEVLKKYTGVGNETVRKNYETIAKSGRQLHIRIPLINGINAENPEKYAEYFASHDTGNIVFEFLSYHEFGKEKWLEEYRVQNGYITDEILKSFKETFKNRGLKIINT